MNGSNGRNHAYDANSCQNVPEALSPNQQKALAALLSTPTVEAAAKECGMGVRTIRRYLATPQFAATYRAQRALVVAETVAGLEKAGTDAVAAMTGALKDEDVNVRLRAARFVIDSLFRGADMERRNREVDEIEAEIQELRELIEAADERNNHY